MLVQAFSAYSKYVYIVTKSKTRENLFASALAQLRPCLVGLSIYPSILFGLYASLNELWGWRIYLINLTVVESYHSISRARLIKYEINNPSNNPWHLGLRESRQYPEFSVAAELGVSLTTRTDPTLCKMWNHFINASLSQTLLSDVDCGDWN